MPREPKYMIINTEWGAFGEQGELDYILTRSVLFS
jgi:hypothetical protein